MSVDLSVTPFKVPRFRFHTSYTFLSAVSITIHMHPFFCLLFFLPVLNNSGNSLDFNKTKIHYGRRYRMVQGGCQTEERLGDWVAREASSFSHVNQWRGCAFTRFDYYRNHLFFFPFFLFFRRVSRCSLQMYTKVLTTGAIQSWGWACSKVERPKVPRLAALSTVSIEPWDLGLSRKASSMVGWTCIWVMYHLYSEEYLCNIPGIVD